MSPGAAMLTLLVRRARLGATGRVGAGAAGMVFGFGGPGAIATTVLYGLSPVALVGVVAELPPDPVTDFGDSESTFGPLADVDDKVEGCAVEFFLLAAFFDRAVPTGAVFPLPRLRFLITSVFKLSGRTTPCSFKNKPHALHSGCPSGFRLQSGVVCVKQLVHVVGTPLFSPLGFGLPGRDGVVDEKPDSGGDEGEDCD